MQRAAATVGAPPGTSLRASRSLLVLDYFRTPYALGGSAAAGLEELRAGGPALLWPSDPDGPVRAALLDATETGGAIPVFARVVPDEQAERLLTGRGDGWRRVRAVSGAGGAALGSVWRAEDGSTFLPFDPDEAIRAFWSESYVHAGGSSPRLKRLAMRGYYRVRPLLPRRVQIRLRQLFSRVQARSKFPRWPAETALHDLYDALYALLAELSGGPVPRIAAWPGGHEWALVLTHDVELAGGYACLDPVLELERRHGLRSAWNFVPLRYEIDEERLRELTADGFEVGVHGLHHDGRDLESLATLRERLPAIREHADRWGAAGFRSPATHRNWDWMPLLGFQHDSSYPDTDPFEPQAGGCCTWLPYFNRDLVELPLTMPQDHTLFAILRHSDESAWIEKADFLRARGGMVLLDTHPDYLTDRVQLRAYARLLEHLAEDATGWHALPRDVGAWWRRRAESTVEWRDDSWQVAGPAAGEARVELVEGRW